MKEITKDQLELLYKAKIIFKQGDIVDIKGNPVSYKKTRHKSYIMDEYADLASNMQRNQKSIN